MKIYVDTSNVSGAGAEVRAKLDEVVERVNRQVVSRAARAVNEVRNAELEILNGQRGGRRYVSPFATTRDKNGKRRKKVAMYTASAPGEPPARRTGMLRLNWNSRIETGRGAGGAFVSAAYESQEKYAAYLEYGTRRMAARPFHDRIVAKARPEVVRIFKEPYV